MANVTLSTDGNYVAGTTSIANNGVTYYDATLTDTLLFPVLAPIGFKHFVIQNGAGSVTLGAASGATITGNTTIVATGVTVMVTKTSATAWVASVYE